MALLSGGGGAVWRGLAAIAALVLAPPLAAAQPQGSGEMAVRAAFLYNFTLFVEWPDTAFDGPAAPFTVCILADEGFKREVEAAMRNEQVRGRRIEVVVPRETDELRRCQIAYFSRGAGEREMRRLAAVRQHPVLTVGEGTRFLADGGIFAFALVNHRVRFDVSRRAADAARLTVSSKLLRVARSVEGDAPL